MNDDEIRHIIKEFLEIQPIRFSDTWEEDLFVRLRKVRNKNIRVLVITAHDNKINEIKETCIRWLRNKYSKADSDDILQEALTSWHRSKYNGTISTETENPELAALWQQVKWRNMDAHSKVSRLDTVPYVEKSYDKPDEDDEANISSDEFFADEKEGTFETESDEEVKESEEVFYDADENNFEVVENLPAEIEPELDRKKGKFPFIYINEKRFLLFAHEEAITFYRLAKRKFELRQFLPSRTNQIFKPVRKTIEDETRKEYHNLEPSTRYYKQRFNFLKNAERRRWMEVAIQEMKMSKEKLDRRIEDLKKSDTAFVENDYRRKKPILSAVAIDSDGSKIETCFKGEVDFTHNGSDKTWDLHCEYALFKHVITDDNMHLLDDGTLYVTLEPCNKRGYWLDGEVEKPKIPCAVRCVQSGAKTVYVGTPDDNPEVYLQGFEILNTGKFTFKLKNGKHVGNAEEIKAAELLESYFRDIEKYPAEKFADKIIYKVGEPLYPILFDEDLMDEVRSINSTFLQRHNPNGFR